jgi:Zn-dependent protease with chaperone function
MLSFIDRLCRPMRASLSLLLPTILPVICLAGLSACVVEPAKPYTALASPDDIRQRTDTVTNLPVLNLIPRADQREQGDSAAATNLVGYRRQGYDVFDANNAQQDPRFDRVLEIFTKVQARSHLADEDLRPVLVERDEFQAYTNGGTVIIFYTGLTETLSEDALAMVIGHEIAHLAAGHVAEQSSRDLVNTDNHAGLGGASLLGSYSIGNEHEADAVGMVYAALAGYDPGAAAAIWKALSVNGDDRLKMFNHSHPSDSERARVLAEQAVLAQELRGAENWQNLRDCNPIYCATKND